MRDHKLEMLIQRIRDRADTLGLSRRAISQRVGHADAIRNIERGHWPKTDRLTELAEALQCTVAWLLGETDDPQGEPGTLTLAPGRPIRVGGFVRAGFWAETNELAADEAFTVPSFGAYDQYRQVCGVIVQGDSMDREFRPGTILIVCDIADYPGEVAPGMFVVVFRRCTADMYEWTVKEYRPTDEGLWLVPHSTNPRHQAFRVPENGDVAMTEDGRKIVEIAVRGVVVGTMSTTPPRV